MLLAVDAGNTNIVFALFEDGDVRARWGIASWRRWMRPGGCWKTGSRRPDRLTNPCRVPQSASRVSQPLKPSSRAVAGIS